MPDTDKQPKTLAEANRLLRTGGKALEELTGEDAPANPLDEIGIRRGFRALTAPQRVPKVYGKP